MKKRKEFKKLNLCLKMLLNKMYKKFGFNISLNKIEEMKEPTSYEKLLMINYIYSLESKNNNIK